MTRYDKIYVIDKECPSYIDPIRDGDGNALMEHEGPVIVLTEKEMKDFLIGAIEFAEQRPKYLPHQNAKEFFQSKTGIQL